MSMQLAVEKKNEAICLETMLNIYYLEDLKDHSDVNDKDNIKYSASIPRRCACPDSHKANKPFHISCSMGDDDTLDDVEKYDRAASAIQRQMATELTTVLNWVRNKLFPEAHKPDMPSRFATLEESADWSKRLENLKWEAKIMGYKLIKIDE